MFKHYLVTAIRHITRHKLYSVINVVGLAMGIAFCLLTFLFVRHEWTYDQFHEGADQIYRVLSLNPSNETGEVHVLSLLPETMGPLLKAEFPQLAQVVRVKDGKKEDIVVDEKSYSGRLLLVDSDFLKVFSFPLLQGDVETALGDPGAIVLRESMARRCFGTENAMGKEVQLALHYWKNEPRTFTVRGVVADPPSNSSIQFDVLLPYAMVPPLKAQSLMPDAPGNSASELNFFVLSDYVFVRLHDKAHIEDVNQGLKAFTETHQGNKMRQSVTLAMQPLREIHFDRRSSIPELELPGNPLYVYVLSGISLSVLMIACVSFTNLSIAQFSTRVREVGVRKMVGAQRIQLMRQFWGESLAVTWLALLLGFALAEFFLPIFNRLIQVPLTMDYVLSFSSILFVLGMVVLIGLISGFYPAVLLSGFEPVAVLKDQLRLNGNGFLRRSLVVLQFAAAILLVIGTTVMFQQIAFLKTKNLGFDGDQIVVISPKGIKMPGENQAQRTTINRFLDSFRIQLENYSGIINVARSELLFYDLDGHISLNRVLIRPPKGDVAQVPYLDVDKNLLETLGVELIAGRNFSTDDSADSRYAVLVNETLVKQFGLEEPLSFQLPLKRQMYFGANFPPTEMRMIQNPEIIGVVKDFHLRTMHEAIPPLIIFFKPEGVGGDLLVRIHPERTAEALAFMAVQWQAIVGDVPFDYVFLNERFDRLYQSEERWQAIVGYASVFALFIACLGVLGLTALAIARRTKEIGIRKVMGATTRHLVALLSKEFMVLILVANVIAWPVAYYAVDRWLQDFAYRIDLGIGLFLIGGFLVFLTAFLTIGFQAFRAAQRNPVDALRYE